METKEIKINCPEGYEIDRDLFLDENEDLIKDYLMID